MIIFNVVFLIVNLFFAYCIFRPRNKVKKDEINFKDFFDNSLAGLFRTAIDDSRILYANQSVVTMLGYESLDDVIRDEIKVVDYYTEERRKEMLEIMARDGKVSDFEENYVFPDGRKVDISVSARIYPEKGCIEGVVVDVTERNRIHKQLQGLLHEKELLLKEIHHRVKNNMQIIASIINLQCNKMDHSNLDFVLKDLHGRVLAMANVHKELYRSENLSNVDFGTYTENMMTYLMSIYEFKKELISWDFDFEEIYLEIEKAVPCALLLNELISNSLKHAFVDGKKGIITVSMSHDSENSKFCLNIKDNGVGLPDGFDPQKSDSLGMTIINSLSQQLFANISLNNDSGLAYAIEFPSN